jgi:hypothetical protein
MQDNFNLAKYLRQGNKLLNENIGGYVDLKPINSLNEDDQTDTYGVDNENDVVTIDLDMAWDDDVAAQAAFDQYGIEVQPTGGNPGTFEVTGRKEDVLAYLKSEYYGMDDQDIATFYPELLEGGANDSMSLEQLMGTSMEIEELEKPEKIYADDDEEFGSYQDRIMGLGGDKIENGIMSLLDDGFEPEDVMDFCKMIIDAHSQGNKF